MTTRPASSRTASSLAEHLGDVLAHSSLGVRPLSLGVLAVLAPKLHQQHQVILPLALARVALGVAEGPFRLQAYLSSLGYFEQRLPCPPMRTELEIALMIL